MIKSEVFRQYDIRGIVDEQQIGRASCRERV